MMNFYKTKLEGTINVPLSKSSIHRILFLGLLNKESTYMKIDSQSLLSDDVKTSLEFLKKNNCNINIEDDILKIDSKNKKYNNEIINCNECATTLRIVIPIMLFLYGEVTLTGSEKLLSRPMNFYEQLFKKYNISYINNGKTIQVKGDIRKVFEQDIIIEKCNSSQFISGLMYVLPFVNKSSKIILIDEMESIPYLKMTANVLSKLNINYQFELSEGKVKSIELANEVFEIKANKKILYPEIDYSSYAFWAVANDLGTNIDIENFKEKNFKENDHPDKEIVNILRRKEDIVDVKDCPDLLPVLLVWSCFLSKEISIINFQRNRIKESNRVEGMVDQLNRIGANITVKKKEIIIKPIKYFLSGKVSSLNDHRIAMAMTIASLKVEQGSLIIEDMEAINKSYPTFLKHYKSLKGKNKYENLY